jgi:hypothetical protein
LQVPLKNNICIPAVLYPPVVVVGTHTEKEAEVEDATNFTNELFSSPKQAFNPEPAQSCTVVPEVFPQTPLKSHTLVALLQEEVPGMVVEQAGIAGGNGAGVLLNVMLQLTSDPALAAVRLSCMHRDQAPFAFCPLFTAPKYPSGINVPVNGAVPALMEVDAVAVKQVPV